MTDQKICFPRYSSADELREEFFSISATTLWYETSTNRVGERVIETKSQLEELASFPENCEISSLRFDKKNICGILNYHESGFCSGLKERF